MARIREELYEIHHVCGHTEEIYLWTDCREKLESRNRYIVSEKAKSKCPDCLFKELEEEGLKAQTESLSAGLPPLRANPGWNEQRWRGEIIRNEVRKNFEEKRKAYLEEGKADRIETLERLINDIFLNDFASWWIANESFKSGSVIDMEVTKMIRHPADPAVVFSPEGEEDKGIVIVTKRVDECWVPWISLKSIKDDEFIRMVKAWGARWNHDRVRWEIDHRNRWSSPEDAAADITRRLLEHGYSVWLQDTESAGRFLRNEYDPEYISRIIPSKKYESRLIAEGLEDEALELFRSMKGVITFSNGAISIPVSHGEKILEMADLYHIKIFPKAYDRINAYIRSEKIKIAPQQPPKKKKSLKDILNSSSEVLDDLRDED